MPQVPHRQRFIEEHSRDVIRRSCARKHTQHGVMGKDASVRCGEGFVRVGGEWGRGRATSNNEYETRHPPSKTLLHIRSFPLASAKLTALAPLTSRSMSLSGRNLAHTVTPELPTSAISAGARGCDTRNEMWVSRQVRCTSLVDLVISSDPPAGTLIGDNPAIGRSGSESLE